MNRTSPRRTQGGRLYDLLKARPNQWIPLPEILSLGFAQFGARILELRRSGLTILNKTEHRDGKVLSWYKLMPQGRSGEGTVRPSTDLQPALFPRAEMERPEARYPD